MNEEELKKGCGKEAGFITFTDDFGNKDGDVMLCGDTTKKINGEIELFLCDTCQARLEGFQKGKLEQKKEELKFLNKQVILINLEIKEAMKHNNSIAKQSILIFNMILLQLNKRIKQLQKEINSQTEQNSDKEVAQPYSKSDTTTKGFILSDGQFQKEVDFAKKEIGEKRK